MDTRRIAQTTPAPTTEKQAIPGYVLRGLCIVTIAAEEILGSYKGGGRYLVPSGSDSDQAYEVRVGTRPERNRCECRGFASHKHCSHVTAAGRVAKRSAVCDSCGVRRWAHDLVEVTEDDESLTWFEHDLLCKGCIVAHGGIS